MNWYKTTAIVLLLAGLVALGVSVASGEGSMFFALFIPVFTSSGPLGLVGMGCIMASFFLFFFGMFTGAQHAQGRQGEGCYEGDGHDVNYGEDRPTRAEPGYGSGHDVRAKKKVSTGGVILIGPIPIIWGSNNRNLIYVQVWAANFE